MSAPVKKCEVCDDTGSKSRDLSGDLDCTSCDAADARVFLRYLLAKQERRDLDGVAWLAYQHGKAAADPVVPVAAQPAVPDAIKNAFVMLTHNDGRYSITLKFNQNSDTCAVHEFLLRSGGKEYNVAAPSLEAQPAGEVERDAARYRYLRDRANDTMPQWPKDKSCWVVQYHHPQGTIPELKSAGMGDELDRTIDSAIAMAQGEKA